MELSRQLALSALAVVMAVMMSACASKPFLKVQYQLPSSSTALTGEAISLTISDLRKDAAFLSGNAKKSIENFNDTYSLVVVRDDGSGNLIGAYDVDSLLREIFKQRLENEGGRVWPQLKMPMPASQFNSRSLSSISSIANGSSVWVTRPVCPKTRGFLQKNRSAVRPRG